MTEPAVNSEKSSDAGDTDAVGTGAGSPTVPGDRGAAPIAPKGVLKNSKAAGALANLRPAESSVDNGKKKASFVGVPDEDDEGPGGAGGAGGGEGAGGTEDGAGASGSVPGSGTGATDLPLLDVDGGEDGGSGGRSLKKASTLPAMPKVSSLLVPSGSKPKGGRKSVQFQVRGSGERTSAGVGCSSRRAQSEMGSVGGLKSRHG